MRLRDVMSAHPVVTTADDADPDRVRGLMEEAGVHHLPVLDGDVLTGVWCRGDDGAVALLDRGVVVELPAEADAEDALSALLGAAEVVVARDEGGARGILTRSDARDILHAALGRGVGRRDRHRPTVIRVVGTGGSGKTTLIRRTLDALPSADAVVLQTNRVPVGPDDAASREVVDESAHRPAGLARALDRLGDARLVMVEGRDDDPDVSHAIGEDVLVAVLAADEALRFRRGPHREVKALVVTQARDASPEAVAAAVYACRARFPDLDVFPVLRDPDDPGVHGWLAWVEAAIEGEPTPAR